MPLFVGPAVIALATPIRGASLKVSQANTDRHPDEVLTRGDEAWAHWDDWAQVVLTQ